MKTLKEVSKLLDINESTLKRFISPQFNHRNILEKLGCIVSKEFMFSEEGIKYTAYQYMSKINECLYYIYPNLKPVEKEVIKPITVKKIIRRR